MLKSNFFRSVLFLLLLMTLVACNADGEDGSKVDESDKDKVSQQAGGELQVAFAQQPPSIDTHVTQSQAGADIARQVFETLVTVNSEGDIQPMLAESWESSDDGKTYTFHLREGVLFHDETEMLAEDVVASLNRWIEITGAGKEQFSGAAFVADGDYTAVLNLEKPTSTTLAILAYTGGNFPAVMPKDVIEAADVDGVKTYIGTGPFKFVEWKQDQHIHMTKFDNYQAIDEPLDGLAGKKEALVDDIYFNFVKDASTRVAGILSGIYDISHAIPLDNVEQVSNDPSLKVHTYPGGYLGLFFNKKQGLFSDQVAREAVLAGLDMEEILQAAYVTDEFYTLNHNMTLSHELSQWSSDVGKDKYNQADLEKAKQLIAESGYNGEEVSIMTTREIEQPYNASIVLQHTLEAMGINAVVNVFDRAAYEEFRNQPESFDIFVQTATAKPEPSSNVYFRRDFGGFTDSEELDEIIADFRGKPSLEDAKEVYPDLQEWFYDYLPIVKVGDFNEVTTTRDTVDNFRHQNGFILWNVSNSKK